MNTLTISVKGYFRNPVFFIDGEPIKMGKPKYGESTYVYRTEKKEIELAVVKVSEVSGRFWFLWNMLFFIISCFGIFGGIYDKSGYCVNYRAKLSLSGQNTANLTFNRFADGQPAITCNADCAGEEYENFFYIDRQAKKRFKILTLTKLFLWLALIAITVAVVIIKIIG